MFIGDILLGKLGINYGYERLSNLDRIMCVFDNAGKPVETIYSARLNGKVDLKELRERLKKHVMQFHRHKCRPFQVYNSQFY
jgi:hypothetical protein